MATVLENLQKARELIAKPDGYIRGARKNGPEPTAFCALGAIDYVLNKEGHPLHNEGCRPEVVALSSCIPQSFKEDVKSGKIVDDCNLLFWNWFKDSGEDTLRPGYVAAYNNTQGQEKTVALFDRAIEVQKEHPTEKVT